MPIKINNQTISIFGKVKYGLYNVKKIMFNHKKIFPETEDTRDDREVISVGTTNVTTANIYIKIWDNSVLDNDIVSLTLNGVIITKVINNIETSNFILPGRIGQTNFFEKLTVPLPVLSTGKNKLVIRAISEGIRSPTTLSVSIHSNSDDTEWAEHTVNAYLTADTAITINLNIP